MEQSLSLMERYTYGNSKIYYGNAEGKTDGERLRNELLVGSPNRQRAMLSLAVKQIETQERAAQEIVASNIAGAEMVSAQIEQQTQEVKFEIQQQTSQLQSTFESVGVTIANSVSSAADKISSSIEDLGNRLSMELAAIHWEIVQQNQTLEKILAVLQENRSNEARQLISQGVRLYVNQKYDKAEERFLRALDFDMTDYQVLMNLGYIELHKENADRSMSYFQDALSLPGNLDINSKVRALWAIARIHYVKKDYQKALFYAEESLKVESSNPKPPLSKAIYDIFDQSPGSRYNDEYIYNTLKQNSLKIESRNPKHIFADGIYAALAEDRSLALSRIQSAIKVDSTLFSLAAIDPDLEPIRQEVLELLGKMSLESFRKAVNSVEEVEQLISQFKNYKGNGKCPDFLPEVQRLFGKAKKLLQQKTYSSSTKCVVNLAFLKYLCEASNKVLPAISQHISQIDKLTQEKLIIEQKLKSQQLKIAEAEKLKESFSNVSLLIFLPPIVFVVGLFLKSQVMTSFSLWIEIALVTLLVFFSQPIEHKLMSKLSNEVSKKIKMQDELKKVEQNISSFQKKIERLALHLSELPRLQEVRIRNFSENMSDELLQYFYKQQSNYFDSSISSYLN